MLSPRGEHDDHKRSSGLTPGKDANIREIHANNGIMTRERLSSRLTEVILHVSMSKLHS